MKKLKDVDAVKNAVRQIVERQKPREPDGLDVSRHRDEIEALLATFDEFLPVWTVLPSVFRVARLQTDEASVAYSDNVTLPAADHTIELVVEMLNYIRQEKGLEEVKMPLFFQPDDIVFALENPAECHCDEEREVAARERNPRRLGRRGSGRWLIAGQKVLDRDGRKCTRCGAVKDLHVHWTDEGSRMHDPAGYLTLCRRCHVGGRAALAPSAAALRFHLGDEPIPGTAIRSQLALVFQKSRLHWVAIAHRRQYVVLKG
jgi:hypothetical protein